MEIPKAVKDFLAANPAIRMIDTEQLPRDRAVRVRACAAQQGISLNRSVTELMSLFIECFPQYDKASFTDKIRRMALGRDVALEDEPTLLRDWELFGKMYREGKLKLAA